MVVLKAILFILLTWGVIMGAALGVGYLVRGATDSWYWAIGSGLLVTIIGVVSGEWLSRIASALLYARDHDDEVR